MLVLKKPSCTGIIRFVVQPKQAVVLSAYTLFIGSWGVGAPYELPLIASPTSFYPMLRGKSRHKMLGLQLYRLRLCASRRTI